MKAHAELMFLPYAEATNGTLVKDVYDQTLGVFQTYWREQP